jgi:hypothetical protein
MLAIFVFVGRLADMIMIAVGECLLQ